ncbi:diguanylate cyclase [Hydrogenovibrio sp. 3SP14C1]|uniref:sensor domain-containing diguanylate cyclase n=1 Tax=Hydrogenovibrio sp. 3SP14C1 TaxID=3038774 RepID=UPI002415FDA0|nr:diguanylate cyclase [Hydrogenovibrio sp. 3SP14C1]MDG4813138.1 diguanylate cyclase [Hydrogenovibrio sp. 3SP14C1]
MPDKKQLAHSSPPRWGYFIAIAFVGVITLLFQLIYSLKQNQALFDTQVKYLTERVQGVFYDSATNLKDKYNFLLLHYSHLDDITRLVNHADRLALYQKVKVDFDAMKQKDPNLFVMHFHDPHNITILRVHNPDAYGDDVSDTRPMVVYVNKNRHQVSAFEAGRTGLSYRINTPFFGANGKYLGVLEFGVKPKYFIDRLKERFHIQSRLLVKKSAFNHYDYQEDYSDLGHYSIIYSDPIFNDIEIHKSEKSQLIHKAGKTYLVVSGLHLDSYDGQPLAEFQVVEDISSFYEKHMQSFWLHWLLNIIGLLVFLILMFFILKRYSDRLIKSMNTINVLQQKNEAMKYSSEIDELTQAYNRRYFNQKLRQLLHYQDNRHPVSVLFYDIDFFKNINDTHGHLVGDEILKALSHFMRNHLRSEDLLVRWGGEEFAIILKEAHLQQAIEKAEELRQLVEGNIWPNDVKMTISISVIELHNNDSLKSLQARLDHLLYQAKESGRNRVEHE